LFVTSHNRLLRQNLELFVPACFTERILHQPVFQRVEADQHQPPSRLQQRPRALEQRLNLSQLVIHSNPKCLKGPSRRMNLVAFHWWGRGRYDLSQFCCSRNRPGPNNGSGDSPRPPFLSEFVNQVGEFVFVFLIYHLLGRLTLARIHPHIKRAIGPKTKSSVRLVQLQTAYAKISKQSI